jgi:peroxiredoxin
MTTEEETVTTLLPNQKVPPLSVSTLPDKEWTLQNQKPENFTMIVVYRGHHCPVCKAYLGELDRLAASYRDAGVDVIAISMNDRATATLSRDEWGLQNIPIGYGLSEGTARAWGLYISKAIKEAEAATFAEPGLFLVRPDGRLYLVNISNMPWGRPNLEELVGKVKFAVEKDYPARGDST